MNYNNSLFKIFFFALCFVLPAFSRAEASSCTIGVANGCVTIDGRALLWKVRDVPEVVQQLVFSSGSPYDYIGIRSQGGPVFMGLNQAGLVTGNSYVESEGGAIDNSGFQLYALRNFDCIDELRQYIRDCSDANLLNVTGCFPFIDSNSNATMFEIERSRWFLEYDTLDPDRAQQGLFGFVVRANEFHIRPDGTDDPNIYNAGGRYTSGTFNVLGLVDANLLSAETITDGNDGANGFEFVRYGPDAEFEAIANSNTKSAMIVQGILPAEDPNLTTMWVILGQTNYGIAVPVWTLVWNIPQCLENGNMYNKARQLYLAQHEQITQQSVFPVESYMFDVINNIFLPHWRYYGIDASDVNRVEHRLAFDANSLLNCLADIQYDNKAPVVNFSIYPDDLTVSFELDAFDVDGNIIQILWDFGDCNTCCEQNPIHIYDSSGEYLVSCTVTDEHDTSITAWKYCRVPVDCHLAGPDDFVDFCDLAFLASHWLFQNCSEPDFCGGADLNRDSFVDTLDLEIFMDNWLK